MLSLKDMCCASLYYGIDKQTQGCTEKWFLNNSFIYQLLRKNDVFIGCKARYVEAALQVIE